MSVVDKMHRGDTVRLESVAKYRSSGAIMDISTNTTLTITMRPPDGALDGSDDLDFTANLTTDGTDGVFGALLLPTALDGEPDGVWMWQGFAAVSGTQQWRGDWQFLQVLPNLG